MFVNWTGDEFIGKWDGKEQKFKPGETRYMEAWKANHYAKHLTDRELQKIGKLTTDQDRQKFLDKCVVLDEQVAEVDESVAEEEALNLEMKKEKEEKEKDVVIEVEESKEVEEVLEEELKEKEEEKVEVVEEDSDEEEFEELEEKEEEVVEEVKEEVPAEEKPKRGRPRKEEK